MKKLICAILSGTMLLTLCACSTKKADSSASPAATASAQPSATVSISPSAFPSVSPTAPADAQTLANILDQINSDMEVGTAGSSLKAVKFAAALLDWGESTKLTTDEINSATISWLSPKGNDEQVAFATEKFAAVKDAVKELLADGGKELLNEAGVNDANYPWNDAAVSAVKIVSEEVLGRDW